MTTMTLEMRKLQNCQEELRMARDEIHRLKLENSTLKIAVGEWIDAGNAPVTSMFGLAERDTLKKAENVLEHTFDMLICKKCGGDMADGQAIEQTMVGMPDFAGDKCAVTVSLGGAGRLVECKKCKDCGWSTT